MFLTRILALTWVAMLWSVLAQGAFAHGGVLDSYGCHNDRKAGGYHCHRETFAGQSFGSKAEMLGKLKEQSAPATPRAK